MITPALTWTGVTQNRLPLVGVEVGEPQLLLVRVGDHLSSAPGGPAVRTETGRVRRAGLSPPAAGSGARDTADPGAPGGEHRAAHILAAPLPVSTPTAPGELTQLGGALTGAGRR